MSGAPPRPLDVQKLIQVVAAIAALATLPLRVCVHRVACGLSPAHWPSGVLPDVGGTLRELKVLAVMAVAFSSPWRCAAPRSAACDLLAACHCWRRRASCTPGALPAQDPVLAWRHLTFVLAAVQLEVPGVSVADGDLSVLLSMASPLWLELCWTWKVRRSRYKASKGQWAAAYGLTSLCVLCFRDFQDQRCAQSTSLTHRVM